MQALLMQALTARPLRPGLLVLPADKEKLQKPGEADHPPVAPEGKAEAETWSDGEIIAGLEECVRLLAPTGAEVEISKPIRNGQCGTPAPVLLKRIAGVEVTPPAVVNCRLAARLDQWMKDTVQPVAEEMLGGRVTRIITASGYTCRQRNRDLWRPIERAFPCQCARYLGVRDGRGPTDRRADELGPDGA
jgi:hypothetical protein